MGASEDAVEVASISREGGVGLYELADHRPVTRTEVVVGGTFSCMQAHLFAQLEKQLRESIHISGKIRLTVADMIILIHGKHVS